jgi:tripartite-type tricarboxylate transporter receptor subunit TctC
MYQADSIWAPAGTPQSIVDQMHTKMAEIAKTPEKADCSPST